jgi:hypothetical protein
MLNSSDTPSFHSFSVVRGDISDAFVDALEQASIGDESLLNELLQNDSSLSQMLGEEDCDLSGGRENCSKSDSTLLLVGLTPVNDDGEKIRMPDDNNVRERLGRYPWGDGNPLSYLRTWSGNPPESEDDIMTLIDKLDEGLFEKTRGHDRFENGSFGRLHGILNNDETSKLEKLLSAGSFKVRADEPLDGGVADIMRHLKTLVRTAARSGHGLLHFSH